MTNPLAQLAANGVSIWLDDLSRTRIESGQLAELITSRSVSGVTTNPTIFAGSIGKGEGYGSQVSALAAAGAGNQNSESAAGRTTAKRQINLIHAGLHAADGVHLFESSENVAAAVVVKGQRRLSFDVLTDLLDFLHQRSHLGHRLLR